MLDMLIELLADESGATVVEYGLLAAMVSIACIAALTAVGTNLSTIYVSILAAIFNSTSDAFSKN
ncbi:MAG: Flp family type IVb pilin [Alphaproteobacteria bacterium]|nr:Flp family type IVb pilin [Alphaproteobacteria bacterium]